MSVTLIADIAIYDAVKKHIIFYCFTPFWIML